MSGNDASRSAWFLSSVSFPLGSLVVCESVFCCRRKKLLRDLFARNIAVAEFFVDVSTLVFVSAHARNARTGIRYMVTSTTFWPVEVTTAYPSSLHPLYAY